MQKLPYYGTYHHTSPEQSELIRRVLRETFFDLFRLTGHPETIKSILDAGSGLGYLSELAAYFFRTSSVTGVDLFGSESLPEGDLELAEENMKAAGVGDRVRFIKSDLTDLDFPEEHFDLAVSNLVFHNLGKKRFDAYLSIGRVLKPGGFFVLGDFFWKAEDKKFLRDHFTMLAEKTRISEMPDQYSIMLLRNK
ncbi:MAG: methyltransferase domain-containing protein [Thermoplasmatales archaeon]|nr:methyltransferase domain-containing protein [Thermoplasmatales archaeon]